MIKQHEIKAAFDKGLEAFLLNYKDNTALIDVLNDYADKLNNFISNCVYKPRNYVDSPVSINYTYSDNNDDIIIQMHKDSESVTLATIKRDNTGAFKKFSHIGSDDNITVNNAEDIEKALLRMLEEPALISALYRLICQSVWPTFNAIDDDKYEAMLTKVFKLVKFRKTKEIDPDIEIALNDLCEHFGAVYSKKEYQFSIERSDDYPDELSIVIQIQKNKKLIKLKTHYGTYPVVLKYPTFYYDDININNRDEIINIIGKEMECSTNS